MPLLRKDLVNGDIFRYVQDQQDVKYVVSPRWEPGREGLATSTPTTEIPEGEVILIGGPSHKAMTDVAKSVSPPTEEFVPALQPHYTARNPEPIDVMEAWFPNNLLRAFALKYIARAGLKGTNEDAVKDLKKAVSYIEREINALQGIKSW